MKTTKPVLAFILLFAGISIQLNAINLTVTSTANSGAGSLRDQIAAADPGDRIVFASSTFGIPIVLTTGQIVIDKELIIAGSGIQSTIIDGNGTSRIFNITSGHVTIHDLTIQNGALNFLFDSGGGIANNSSDLINIFYCVFQSCSVPGDGGGISNSNGEMRISACTFDGNHAGNDGGGIKIYSGTVYIQGCTFTNNTADVSGGGIQRGGGTVSIAISTLSGNTALQYGGGFDGATELIHCTVAYNSASIAGGGGTATTTSMSNCIVYNNTALYGGAPDLFGEIESGGHNIIGDTSGCTGYAPTDMFVNPLLDTLADNGGLTKTIALLCGSPAIDAADSTTTYNDQRGTPIFGDRRDIGAFEYATVCPILTASLTGDINSCAFDWVTYSTETGMTNYTWAVTGAAYEYDIVEGGGPGDDFIRLRWNTDGNHIVTVSYTNPAYSCCTVTSASTITNITGATLPEISGPSQVCINTIVTYAIDPEPGTMYSLDIVADQSEYTLISGGGQNDSSITVQWLTSGLKVVDLTYFFSNFSCHFHGTLPVDVSSALISEITGDEVICSGGSTTLDAGSYSSYLWSTAETTQTISVNTAGTFTVTVTDANGCTGSTSVTTTVNPLPVISIGGSLSFCAGSSTTLNAGTFTSYNWSTGATTQTISVNTGAPFSVTVTDANGCTGSTSVTTTVNPLPVINISGNLSFCAGSSTTLNAGTFASYNWSTGATTQTITVNTAATFTVTVTNSNGCTKSASVSTTINQNPSCTISGSGTICAGASTQWCAPAGLLYNWSNGATTQCITRSATGNYSVTTTDVKGCSSTCNKQLTVGTQLTIDAGVNKIVYRGYADSSCTTLTATGAGGGNPPYTLTWTGGSHATSISVCPTTSTTYYLTITDANNCSFRDSVRVCVFDVRCGSGNKKVTICHGTGSANNPFQTLCILPADAKWHFLNHPGEKLGACGMVKTCGFSTLRESDEEMTEGVEEEMGLTVYPNPAQNEINISLHSEVDGKYLLRLVDITGQILLSEMKDVSAGENKYTVNLQNFAPGIYLVLMQSGESIMQTRIIKE